MTTTIQPVDSKARLRQFIETPRRLYAGMDGFVPPLDHERRQLLDPARSGFHTHGQAAYFLAMRGGEVVGRSSAQIDDLATGPQHEGVGLFGCLDAIDDGEVVAALLDAAEAWLRARGRRRVRGPFLLSINGESGLLLTGQQAPPMLLLPWHPAYLRGHLERNGYSLAKTLHASSIDLATTDLAAPVARLGIQRRRAAFTIRAMRLKGAGFAEDVETGRRIFNDAWSGNWGFVPVSKAEMAKLVEGFKPLLKADYGVYVERHGKVVGFALVLPNLFDLAVDLGGSPSVIAWLKLAFRSAIGQFSSGRIVLFGVARDMIGTLAGSSVALILVDEMIRRSGRTPFRQIECGWILEDNVPMQALVELFGARPTRSFGIFEKDLFPVAGEEQVI
jgi:hypothetical protein